MILLGYSQASHISAALIENASEGRIQAVRHGRVDINWGRRNAAGLNPDISNAVNKRVARELFAEHEVPAPRLYADWMEAMSEWDDGPTARILGRPDFHTRGRGFWLCSTTGEVERALRGTRRKMAATHFMEYITRERAPREYRVHIFMGKSIRISEKKFDETGDYTTIKPTHPIKHVRRAAKKAVAAVGLDFGAVDVMADDEHAYVLEVNCAPGLGGSMPRVWAETFTNWKEGRDES